MNQKTSMTGYSIKAATALAAKNKMKNAIAKYINSKMDLGDEVQFQNDMLAIGFTKPEGCEVLMDIHKQVQNGSSWEQAARVAGLHADYRLAIA